MAYMRTFSRPLNCQVEHIQSIRSSKLRSTFLLTRRYFEIYQSLFLDINKLYVIRRCSLTFSELPPLGPTSYIEN